MKLSLTINGKAVSVEAPESTPLLWVLRDYLQLTGTKYGCGMALCGACTVLSDGNAIRACTTPAQSVQNKKITTIEGIQNHSEIGQSVVQAWEEHAVVQCGYCQSGQILSATALLSQNSAPSDEDINAAMSGNICRCATYKRIRDAIKSASKKLASSVATNGESLVQVYTPGGSAIKRDSTTNTDSAANTGADDHVA